MISQADGEDDVVVLPDEVWAAMREHLDLPQPGPGAWHA
uniref:Uncharacterized protein n=1 Tax=Microbacterium phage Judebell TaxID=3230835 RepID=A0AAU8EF04_9CAUD